MIPRAHLRQLFADLSGIPCIWEGDPEPFQGTAGLVRLSLAAPLRALGIDDVRQTFDVGSQLVSEVQCGLRLVVLGIKVTSAGGASVPAFDGCENIRTRLRRRSIRDRLNLDNMSLSSVDGINDFAMSTADNKSIYVSQMNVSLLMAVNDDYTAPPANTYNRTLPAIPATLPAEDLQWVATVNTDDTVPGTFT